MANEKKSDFVVSDRRKFTTEGELKPDAPVEESQPEETQLPRENVVEMKRPEEATTSRKFEEECNDVERGGAGTSWKYCVPQQDRPVIPTVCKGKSWNCMMYSSLCHSTADRPNRRN